MSKPVLDDPGALETRTDEELVERASAEPHGPAASVLWRRVQARLSRYIARLTPICRLTAGTKDEVEQAALFAFCEVLKAYHAERANPDQSHPFRVLFWKVLQRRALDFARRSQQQRQHEDPAVDGPSALAFESSHLIGVIGLGVLGAVDSLDPADLAEKHELHELLTDAIGRLEGIDRAVAEALLADTPLTALAPQLGVSYKTVLRHHAKVIAYLRRELGGPDAK